MTEEVCSAFRGGKQRRRSEFSAEQAGQDSSFGPPRRTSREGLHSSWAFATVEAIKQKQNQERNQGARRIEKGVPGRSSARSHKRLVDFIEGGIGGGNEPSSKSPRPVPPTAAGTDAAVEKDVEDEIFGEMGAFADGEVK